MTTDFDNVKKQMRQSDKEMSWERGYFRRNDQLLFSEEVASLRAEGRGESRKSLVRCVGVLEADRYKFFQALMSFLIKYLN